MKIGIVCPYSQFMPGGVQEHVASQAAELRRRGYQVRILTPRPQNHTDEPPADIIFLGQSRRIRTPQHTSVDISMSVDTDLIDRVLEQEAFDLIHIHEPLIPILALQLLPRLECPVIGTFHAALPDTLLSRMIAESIGPYKRSIFKYLDLVTVVSPAATSYIRNDIDAKKIHIVPNGIQTTKFAPPTGAKRDPFTILYLGRLEKRKGVRYLLNAAKLVQENVPDVKLVVAGDGPERNMLESRARQLKLRNVEFLGHVTEEQKRDLLARCTIFTSPAIYGESFGIVLLEAMAAGAVTVAGLNPGYESVLVGTGRLSLVDSRSAEEYARRLELLMTEPALQRTWRTWARSRVQQYSYEAIVDHYEELYQQLVPGKQP